jgi:hypothetical protein
MYIRDEDRSCSSICKEAKSGTMVRPLKPRMTWSTRPWSLNGAHLVFALAAIQLRGSAAPRVESDAKACTPKRDVAHAVSGVAATDRFCAGLFAVAACRVDIGRAVSYQSRQRHCNVFKCAAHHSLTATLTLWFYGLSSGPAQAVAVPSRSSPRAAVCTGQT